MAARRRRVGTRSRMRGRAASAKVVALAHKMEEPLHEAIDDVQALLLMGQGLIEMDSEEDGRAIVAVAWRACQRLEAIRQTWDRLYKAGVQAKAAA
jgi:hypothetical protein